MRFNGGDTRGVALPLVMAVILLMSTLAAALIMASSVESLVARHFQSGVEALSAASAMLERAAADLRALPDWTMVLNGSVHSPFLDGLAGGLRTTPDGSTVNLTEIVNQADCGRDRTCTAGEMDAVTADRPWGANNPRWRVFGSGSLSALVGSPGPSGPLYVVALVADDGMENDGDPETDGMSIGGVSNPGLGVVVIRAEAFAAGGVTRVVQATVRRGDAVGLAPGSLPRLRILTWHEMR
jgi:hypothetical protein